MSVRYDWPKLKAEFLDNETYFTVQTWLREAKGFTDDQLRSGNVLEHTVGWGIARAEHQHKIRKSQTEQKQAVMDALTPLMIEAKASILLSYLDMLQNGELVQDYAKGKLVREYRRRLSTREISHILTKLKTELGEPAVITKQNTDDPERGASVMEAVLVAYGIKDLDGRLLIGPNKPTEPTDAQG